MSKDQKLSELNTQLNKIREELSDIATASWRSLAADYTDCKADLTQVATEVSDTFSLMINAKHALAEAKKDAEFHLNMVILSEMGNGTDKLAGKNADIRKLKLEVFVGQLPAEDPQYKQLNDAVTTWELAVDQATIDYETARNRMSAIRNTARMLAGLGHAMGA